MGVGRPARSRILSNRKRYCIVSRGERRTPRVDREKQPDQINTPTRLSGLAGKGYEAGRVR